MLLRYLAILIGICYLLNPLHQQINWALHTLSHSLDLPDYVLSHKHADSGFDDEAHKYHQNDNGVRAHEHGLISFFSSIFIASDGYEHSDENLPVPIKIDKHITSYPSLCAKIHYKKVHSVFWETKEQLLNGHHGSLYRPPQDPMGNV